MPCGALSPGGVTHAMSLGSAQLAWLTMQGHRQLDNRPASFGVQHEGWVALHVVKTPRELRGREAEWLADLKLPDEGEEALPAEDDLPHGAVVGAVRIDKVVTDKSLWEGDERPAWAQGPCCFVIGATVRLTQPLRVAGRWPRG